MLDPRTKFPHTVGATWGNALATFQNAGFWCATTLLAHYIPGFSRDGLEKSRSLAAGGGIWCLRAWCKCQRTQFLLGEGVKAQVVKSGLRPLALGRWVVHHIPSRSERELGKRSGATPKTGNVVHSKPNANTKTAHPAKNFNRMRCLNSAEDVGFEPTRVVKPARVPGV